MAFSQTLQCRVYFEDTDAGGVVYYANYLKFYERARTEFLRTLGYEQDELLQQNVVFVVRNITVDFKQAARFNELLLVQSSIKRLKKLSLVFDQAIYSNRGDQQILINQAEVKLGCVSADHFAPQAIPESIMRTLSNHE